jgi:hypothetical protein
MIGGEGIRLRRSNTTEEEEEGDGDMLVVK